MTKQQILTCYTLFKKEANFHKNKNEMKEGHLCSFLRLAILTIEGKNRKAR